MGKFTSCSGCGNSGKTPLWKCLGCGRIFCYSCKGSQKGIGGKCCPSCKGTSYTSIGNVG